MDKRADHIREKTEYECKLILIKELMTLKQWVCHLDKVPKNPITGGNAMADKPET